MVLTGILTKPTLRGTIVAAGPWQALFARGGYRVYPYTAGCAVRTTVAANQVNTYGLGQFTAGDYALVCTRTAYGSSHLYIPDVTKLHLLNGPSAVNDVLSFSTPVTADQHDWLLNVGVDPTLDLDASPVTLYNNPVGDGGAQANKFFLTGQHGQFQGWVEDGDNLLDLLITDSSGTPIVMMPSFQPGGGFVA